MTISSELTPASRRDRAAVGRRRTARHRTTCRSCCDGAQRPAAPSTRRSSPASSIRRKRAAPIANCRAAAQGRNYRRFRLRPHVAGHHRRRARRCWRSGGHDLTPPVWKRAARHCAGQGEQGQRPQRRNQPMAFAGGALRPQVRLRPRRGGADRSRRPIAGKEGRGVIDEHDHILRPFDACEAIPVHIAATDCRRKATNNSELVRRHRIGRTHRERSHGGFLARRFSCCSMTTWARCAHISEAIEQANASRSISCAPA